MIASEHQLLFLLRLYSTNWGLRRLTCSCLSQYLKENAAYLSFGMEGNPEVILKTFFFFHNQFFRYLWFWIHQLPEISKASTLSRVIEAAINLPDLQCDGFSQVKVGNRYVMQVNVSLTKTYMKGCAVMYFRTQLLYFLFAADKKQHGE